MRRIREKVDGILEKNPSARENLASFFESLLGMDEEEDIRREVNIFKLRHFIIATNYRFSCTHSFKKLFRC